MTNCPALLEEHKKAETAVEAARRKLAEARKSEAKSVQKASQSGLIVPSLAGDDDLSKSASETPARRGSVGSATRPIDAAASVVSAAADSVVPAGSVVEGTAASGAEGAVVGTEAAGDAGSVPSSPAKVASVEVVVEASPSARDPEVLTFCHVLDEIYLLLQD